MEIQKNVQLSPTQISQLSELWNQEYPTNLNDRFGVLLDESSNLRHYIITNSNGDIDAWAILFEKDDETRFSIIVNKEHQGRGLGKALIRALQEDCNAFYGWVIDHNNDLKADGSNYLSPLEFYTKIGFKVLKDVRIDTEMIHCVKVYWSSDQETFETWNNVAHLYEEKFMPMDFYNASYDAFCALLPSAESTLLELGCGPGNISKYMLDRHPNFKWHGIDISQNMIDLAAKNNPSATFEVMDIREIATIKNKFHGIIGGFCIPYLNEQEVQQLFENCRALLQPEGCIYISFLEAESYKSEYKEGSGGRVLFHYHSLNRIQEELQLLDFNHFETFHVDYPVSNHSNEVHTLIIAQHKINQA